MNNFDDTTLGKINFNGAKAVAFKRTIKASDYTDGSITYQFVDYSVWVSETSAEHFDSETALMRRFNDFVNHAVKVQA